jgi:hypothetical protein
MLPGENSVEKRRTERTDATETVRSLLERLPDDGKRESLIEEIVLLDGPCLDESELPPLTDAKHAALAESIEHHRRHPDARTPWRDALQRLGQER